MFSPKTDQFAPTSGLHKEFYTSNAFDTATGTYPKSPLTFPMIYVIDGSGRFSFYVKSIDNTPAVFFTPTSGNFTTPFVVSATASEELATIASVSLTVSHSNGTVYPTVALVSQGNGTYSATINPSAFHKGVCYFAVTATDSDGHIKTATEDLYMGNPLQITNEGSIIVTRTSNTVAYNVVANITGLYGTVWSQDTTTYSDGNLITVDETHATITDTIPIGHDQVIRHYDIIYSDTDVPSVTQRLAVTINPQNLHRSIIVDPASVSAIQGSQINLSALQLVDGSTMGDANPSDILFHWELSAADNLAHSITAYAYSEVSSGYVIKPLTIPAGAGNTASFTSTGRGTTPGVSPIVYMSINDIGTYTLIASMSFNDGPVFSNPVTMAILSSCSCDTENCSTNCPSNVVDCLSDVVCSPNTYSCPSHTIVCSAQSACLNDIDTCAANCPSNGGTCSGDTSYCSPNSFVCAPNSADSCPSNDYSTVITNGDITIPTTSENIYIGDVNCSGNSSSGWSCDSKSGDILVPLTLSGLPPGASVSWSIASTTTVEVGEWPVTASVVNDGGTFSISATFTTAAVPPRADGCGANCGSHGCIADPSGLGAPGTCRKQSLWGYTITATITHVNWTTATVTKDITVYPS